MKKKIIIGQTNTQHNDTLGVGKWMHIPVLISLDIAPRDNTRPALGYYNEVLYYWDVTIQSWVAVGGGKAFIATDGNLALAQRVGDTLIGIKDKFTGEYVAMNKTTVNAAGATITDADVDGIMYFKMGSEYFTRVISESNIKVNWFGAKTDGTDQIATFQAALTHLQKRGGGTLLLGPGTYTTLSSATLIVTDNITVRGEGKGTTTMVKTAAGTRAHFEVRGSNVVIRDFTGSFPNATSSRGHVEIINGENIRVEDCNFREGIRGVQLSPPSNTTIRNVSIVGNLFYRCNYGCYIGSEVPVPGTAIVNDVIENVIIYGNTFEKANTKVDGSGNFIGEPGDGIKATRKCSNLLIDNNFILDNMRDGVDMFASGDHIVLTNNIIKNNTIKGIDIKSDTNGYPEAVYGFNGRFIEISKNIIEGNLSGIGIARNATYGDYNYGINIEGNKFISNAQNGINSDAKHMKIRGNDFFYNGTASLSNNLFHAVVIGDDSANRAVQNCIVDDNIFINNGAYATDGVTPLAVYAIRCGAQNSDVIISNNRAFNDPNLPNAGRAFYGIYVNGSTTNIKLRANAMDGLGATATWYTMVSGAGVDYETVTIYNNTAIASNAVTPASLNTAYPAARNLVGTVVRYTNLTDAPGSTVEAVKHAVTGGGQWTITSNYAANARHLVGTASPEGAVTAPVGVLYVWTTGGAGSILWVKQSGTGNTGWAPIA